ncbi:MAG: DUF4062 domain-containing protein [Haliscomenobacteraceae bacterium CHB4]|nr:hypothetical protein [Saprospiraceae bacterium]MCE7924813.1 DUF4062 domain-containing protein [Haliscomenobacteraceae bacterium CHB4]
MSTSATQVKKAMISSTVRDLPEHRKHVMDACLRQSMLPKMMEHLPANDLEAISASLKMVDEADIYIGVFAFCYGYVPKDGNPDQISVTEMEYRRAKERGIPRLIFIMDKGHPISFDDVEMGESAEKLKIFKEKVGTENIVNFFKSPEELRSLVINSLSQLPKDDKPHQFHYVHPIPTPPEPYVAHPYTLLQARGLFGRQQELNLLTDWITGKGPLADVRIFNIIAIGGMGKSALTWHWFENVVPLEKPQLAGRFWWSFYESDAYFENFVIRTLAYVSRRSIEETQKINVMDREAELLRILDREPHLLVLDGLERILIAYARMDAAHLADDDYDKQTANWVARAYGLPESAAQSFTGEHRLRKTADPRAGNFLRKLARVQAGRILVSSRLYPFDLQMPNGDPGPGCSAIFLRGLNDSDALDLWRNFGVSGQRDELLRLFRTFENHPLLLQALAGEIARYRLAPGDFDRWRKDKPDFDPFSLPLKQAKSHVLFHSMHGLNEAEQKALHTIAAFRMPAQYETLQALLVRTKRKKSIWSWLFEKNKTWICDNENELDSILQNLEDRGLMGWDRRANRYDLHPVVRGVVWSGVSETGKKEAYTALQGYLEAASKIDDYLKVESLEDLTPAIELFYIHVSLHKYLPALIVFMRWLDDATLYKLGKNRLRVQMLEEIWLNSKDLIMEQRLFRARIIKIQRLMWNPLALSYSYAGEPGKSIKIFEENNQIEENNRDFDVLFVGLLNLSEALIAVGKLQKAEKNLLHNLNLAQNKKLPFDEEMPFTFLGFLYSLMGKNDSAESHLSQSLQRYKENEDLALEGVVSAFQSLHSIFLRKPETALSFANCAWELAHDRREERHFIHAARLQGQATLGLGDFDTADERLHHALTRARAINFVQEELPALIALAELRRQQGKTEEAREYLDDVWEAAERGPYPLYHADACNVLCQLERDAGNTEKAIEAATQAYRLAWCDGPPWAYHYGLENAKKHLRELGAPEPEMPSRHS